PMRVTSRTNHCFGPNERNLSKSVGPLPALRQRDWSPPPPTERSASVAAGHRQQIGGSSSSGATARDKAGQGQGRSCSVTVGPPPLFQDMQRQSRRMLVVAM
ncbi:unnamed protein product, partial [Polarella glacialis]